MKIPKPIVLSSASLILWLSCTFAHAQIVNQETYDLSPYSKDNYKDCVSFIEIMQSKPSDVRFGVAQEQGVIFITFSDEKFFKDIFNKSTDGIAIDVMARELFDCDKTLKRSSALHKGYLLPPVYKKEIETNSFVSEEGFVLVRYPHEIPPQFDLANTEFRIMIVQKKTVCLNQNIIDLDMRGWDLLEAGLYLDTLKQAIHAERYSNLNKTLHFNIFFQKDKSEYNTADLKPLYDTLRLTDYAIQEIHIRAYTSVEGSLKRNLELQNKRAQSIINALQSFQSEKIVQTVSSNENWVEFFEDLSDTKYNPLLKLSKEEIKAKLTDPLLLGQLEPWLSKHRKAIIELKLEKRVKYQSADPETIKKLFNESLAEKNVQEALLIQKVVFERVGDKSLNPNALGDLEIPRSVDYGSLLINKLAYEYELNASDLYASIRAFEELLIILPNNPLIKYNLVALRLKSWPLYPESIDKLALKKELDALKRLKLDQRLVKRLEVNYHILLVEEAMLQRDYAGKSKALKFIYDNYRKMNYNQQDVLRLAKYFSYMSQFDWANNALKPFIKRLDVEEDLVFYYINLNIFDDVVVKRADFRTIVSNASNLNQARFCQLFNTFGHGGVSFQLLENPYLKNTYCENCSQE